MTFLERSLVWTDEQSYIHCMNSLTGSLTSESVACDIQSIKEKD